MVKKRAGLLYPSPQHLPEVTHSGQEEWAVPDRSQKMHQRIPHQDLKRRHPFFSSEAILWLRLVLEEVVVEESSKPMSTVPVALEVLLVTAASEELPARLGVRPRHVEFDGDAEGAATQKTKRHKRI